MVSHDLKSPVVGAASLFNLFLHRLQEDYPEIRNDPGMHELLDRIPGSFTKMLTFIDTLLNYAMAGKIIGDMQTVSLGKILQTVIEQFEQEQQQGIVKFKLPSKWPKVQCDVLKMSQVWQNLIGNSIKYRGILIKLRSKLERGFQGIGASAGLRIMAMEFQVQKGTEFLNLLSDWMIPGRVVELDWRL